MLIGTLTDDQGYPSPLPRKTDPVNLIKNMKVGTRLISAFLVLCALCAGVGAIGMLNLSRLSDMSDDMYFNELMGLSHIKESNLNLVYAGRARSNAMLATTDADRQRFSETARKSIDTAIDFLGKAEPLFSNPQAQRDITEMKALFEQYRSDMRQVLDMAARESLSTRSADLDAALSKTSQQSIKLDDMMTGLSQIKETNARENAEATTGVYKAGAAFMLFGIAAAVGIGIALGVFISRSITRPLQQAVKVAETVASGDLTSRIEAEHKDETGQLLNALKRMNDSLVGIVGSVRQSSESIATGSTQIATGNNDLSQRTEEQASNLQQTAASMEQITSNVRQSADTAQQANQMATQASQAARDGGQVVSEVVQTMQGISQSSRKMADIITVIDGIAFQTNILALNAAVEAARAGEQGRGFAVVAGEVRNLAQRSATAAKEIAALIQESVEKVEKGSQLADGAGRSMEHIVDQVRRVTDMMAEISASSAEQTQGINQVSDAVSQLDQVTQQNAALVEESAAAADSLKSQAAKLAELVGVFKLAHQAA